MVGSRAGRVAFAWLALACVTLHSWSAWDALRQAGVEAAGRSSALELALGDAQYAQAPSHSERAAVAHDAQLVQASNWVELRLPRLHVALLSPRFLTTDGVRAFERAMVELHSPREHLRFSALASRAPPSAV